MPHMSNSGHPSHTWLHAPLLLHTDGVMEARDTRRSFHPLEERVAHWARRGPAALVQHVQRDLLAHVRGALGDDAAVVAVQCVHVPSLSGLHLGGLLHGASLVQCSPGPRAWCLRHGRRCITSSSCAAPAA
ncbi:SpoIIE family protein phosphatase [Streptomyces sp. NPDC004629]|uniref:SpoIIE family protein phosphatase n=1 Tax=Streptomyces sp. NPDC004629 TaxID=3364705 RepID=UPI003682539A